MPADRDYLSQLLNLEGKVALVTGARVGIGAAAAVGLARAGASVCLTSRSQPGLEPVAETVRGLGAKALTLPLDVRDSASIAAAVGKAAEHFGRIDLLVNNAGVAIRGPALGFREEDWDKVMETNVRGVFLMSQAVGGRMAEAGGGRIVSLSSTFARVPAAGRAAYATSKAALEHLTRVLAREWAPEGVTVNAVAPTTILTESRAAFLASPEDRRRRVAEIPLGRMGETEDVVAAILFLAGPAGAFVTGQTLYVDGGFSLR